MSIQYALLRLYPRCWRERYAEEMLAMLEQRPLSLTDGLNLFFGALDAHLHPHLGTTSMPLYERILHMFLTLRRSLLTLFCAYVGFIVAGIGFQKLTEYSDFTEAAQANPLMGLTFNLVVIGAVVALLAILVGGLPIAFAVIRSSLARKRYGSLVLLAGPIIAFVIFLGTTLLLESLDHPNAEPLAQLLTHQGIFLGVFIAAAIASPATVCFAVIRSEIPEKLLRFALLPFMLAVLSMLLVLVSTLIWGLSLHNSVPALFNSNEGMFGTSTSGSWIKIVIMMAIATIVAVVAVLRGWSARSALRTTPA